VAVLFPGKLLYLCTPHTASYATTQALEKIEGAVVLDYKHVGLPEIEAGDFRLVKVRRGDEFKTLFKAERDAKTFLLPPSLYTRRETVMSTMRNPYDLVATWWALDRYGFSTLTAFITELEDQRFAELDYLVRQGSRVLRYEHLDDDLNAALADVGLEPVEIPRSNVTPDKRPWREYYDRESLDAVNARFDPLFDRYGYERL